MNVESIKKQFPVLSGNPKFSYLDSVASSQTPYSVLEKIENYYTQYRANIHRGVYSLSEKATDAYENARTLVAEFIGADSRETIFTSGSTESMNMLVYSLEQESWEEGDEIVTTIMEHHSTLIPLQEFAKRRGLVLKHIPITKEFLLDYGKARELITDKTRLVVVTWVSNVLGTINDVEQLVHLAHTKGALIALDGAQAVGHMPIRVRDVDCDFLFFSGHKMCGPTGIGVLYGKKELLRNMRPSIFGGGTVHDVTLYDADFVDAPHKFEGGTQNIAGAIGLAEATSFLKGLGLGAIYEHTCELTEYAYKRLLNMRGVSVYTAEPSRNAGIVSFTVDGIHPHDVSQVCADEGVAVRAGHHCAKPLGTELGVIATTRASFYVYNTKNDVDHLTEAIQKVQKKFA